jgi:putative NADH-flavin reductase
MKIASFGVTGKTGKVFFPKALEKGYQLKCLLRNPEKIKINNENLEIIKGDILNKEDVENMVKGTDIVVSLFGQVKGSPKDLQTQGTINIVNAMKKHGIKKIISLSGGGLRYKEDKPKIPDYIIKGIMKIFVPHLLEDAKEHAEVLRKSGLDWVIVRGPRLNDNEPKGKYRVGWVGVNASTKISRADFADFLVTQIEDNNYLGTMPFISD